MIDQNQLENVKYFNYLDCIITNNARCTYEIKSTNVMGKTAFNSKKTLLICKLNLNIRKIVVKC